jgi:hypothetical protein
MSNEVTILVQLTMSANSFSERTIAMPTTWVKTWVNLADNHFDRRIRQTPLPPRKKN